MSLSRIDLNLLVVLDTVLSAVAATSNSSTRGQVKFPHLTAAR
jgi:hypothetical protein